MLFYPNILMYARFVFWFDREGCVFCNTNPRIREYVSLNTLA